MATSKELTGFVHEALAQGRGREEIRDALTQAGWSEREISEALEAYVDTGFLPPVPRPRLQLTARDAFVYALLFTALGFTSGYLVTLIHAMLTLAMPDAADSDYVAIHARDNIRLAISFLVVSTPVYLWLTVRTQRALAQDAGQRRSLVRKWLTYLALFLAALAFAGDVTGVIYVFLQGEITLRFVLKAAVVAAVAAAVLLFYMRDVEGRDDQP